MRTVFFDVDTQLDFLYPAGALYVPGAENIVNALTALTRFATANRILILSTVDAHSENDPEFKTWKPHCIAGTVGQQKASVTLLNQPLILHTSDDALERKLSLKSRCWTPSQTRIFTHCWGGCPWIAMYFTVSPLNCAYAALRSDCWKQARE